MTKGRTHRKRKLRSQRKTITLESDNNIINLRRWIKTGGFKFYKRMKLVEFTETGRGVMALEEINCGDLLVEVPFELILTVIKLGADTSFMDIIRPAISMCIKFTCQELLAFYLSYLILSKDSIWMTYIDTLPTKLSMPYFCNKLCLQKIDSQVYDCVASQEIMVQKSYSQILSVLKQANISNFLKQNVVKKFDISVYEWSFFIVNSRCVYIDPDCIKTMYKGTSICADNIFDYLSDEPKMGLIPYMDMFNHSHKAVSKINFNNRSSDVIDTQSHKIESNTHYNFKLFSFTKYNRFDQIFICYGEFCNFKLLTEYGFRINQNPYTIVPFSFEEIYKSIQSFLTLFRYTEKKYKYIKKHNLDIDLYISEKGYSYNFLRLLFIIISEDTHKWNSKIFSCSYDENELSKMNNLGSKLLIIKKNKFESALFNVQSEVFSLTDCIYLIKEYICLLEDNVRNKIKNLNDT